MRKKEGHICLPDWALAKEMGVREGEVATAMEELIKVGLVRRIRCPKCGGPAFILLAVGSEKERALIGDAS